MRKWHRWLAVVFGVFLLWIALTGFGIQVLTLTQGDGDEHEEHAAADAQAGKFALVSPAQAHGDEEHDPPVDLQAAGAPRGLRLPQRLELQPANVA